jgi:LysM repeat protein
MSEYEETAEVDAPVVVEHVTVVEEPAAAGEMLRFFALIIILGVVVLVVAVIRPLIFGRIVPAVMGEGIVVTTTESPVNEGEEENNTAEEPAGTGQSTEEAAGASDNSEIEAPSEENTAGEAESPPTNEAETVNEGEAEAQEETTVENQPAPLTHTVIQGETLQKIAAQYGITLQELIAANNLPNPDYIRVGDKLLIPQAEGGE